ncbi:hypothetical protein FRC07_003188 [Ceratobasidium sp. 392]|nr:hypothetical protein FRC07_003188 [Ceratobasidium sp. 392]
MLRAEGYTPEEVAVRLIPGYIPVSQASATTSNDPPHQAPESSPPTQEQPQLLLVPDAISQLETSTEQPMDIPSPRHTPLITPLSTNPPDQNIDPDDDILMPASSPPLPSPTPSPKPDSPAQALANDMSIDRIEDDIPKPSTDFLVPVSSPPPAATRRSSSVGSRTPRLRRRSSFSQMSSSPPDEFTGPRNAPIPQSPSIDMMVAEREKELKAQEVERGRAKEREKEDVRDWHEAGRGRGSPVGTLEARKLDLPPVERARTAVSSRGGIKIKRGRGRGRGLQISTPGRQLPPSTIARRLSPGLRIESRSTASEPRRPVAHNPISQGQPMAPQTPHMDTQLPLDVTMTADQMISQYTHAESDDEDILNDLKAGMDNPDLGLQTQPPYTSQTQNSYPSQTGT